METEYVSSCKLCVIYSKFIWGDCFTHKYRNICSVTDRSIHSANQVTSYIAWEILRKKSPAKVLWRARCRSEGSTEENHPSPWGAAVDALPWQRTRAQQWEELLFSLRSVPRKQRTFPWQRLHINRGWRNNGNVFLGVRFEAIWSSVWGAVASEDCEV
jgi:hypothetical protein